MAAPMAHCCGELLIGRGNRPTFARSNQLYRVEAKGGGEHSAIRTYRLAVAIDRAQRVSGIAYQRNVVRIEQIQEVVLRRRVSV